MRELSRESGVSIATIKFYIREGILPPGEHIARNQSEYGETHLQRLQLIRALREVGGLGVATIRDVLTVATTQNRGIVSGIGMAMDALSANTAIAADSADDESVTAAAGRMYSVLNEAGWQIRPDAGALRMLARAALGAGTVLGSDESGSDVVTMYSDLVMELARREAASGDPTIYASGESAIAGAVAGTVLFEPYILALRRLAHEHLTLAQLPAEVRAAIVEGRTRHGRRPEGA